MSWRDMNERIKKLENNISNKIDWINKNQLIANNACIYFIHEDIKYGNKYFKTSCNPKKTYPKINIDFFSGICPFCKKPIYWEK